MGEKKKQNVKKTFTSKEMGHYMTSS